MNTESSIKVEKQDILPLIYFIVSMFQKENTHRQGTSSKSDLLGGYIDRWVNKIPENIIFNKILLKDKSYKVINDYFIYGNGSDKNAPDILGLTNNNIIIKFAEFIDNTWNMIDGMPHIEVKTFRKNQKLVSVREQQLEDDKFYVFVESDFKPDYLIKLLSDEVIDSSLMSKIIMPKEFIKSNKKGLITQPIEINLEEDEEIGNLEIISIIKGVDYKHNSVKCGVKEDVYYIKEIKEVNMIRGQNVEISLLNYMRKSKNLWNGKKVIPFCGEKFENIIIKKINKKSFYCTIKDSARLYETNLQNEKIYKIDLELFERSSSWNEYIALKNQFINKSDRRNELIELLDKIVRANCV